MAGSEYREPGGVKLVQGLDVICTAYEKHCTTQPNFISSIVFPFSEVKQWLYFPLVTRRGG